MNNEIAKKLLSEDNLIKKVFPDGVDLFGDEIAIKCLLRADGIHITFPRLRANKYFVKAYLRCRLKQNPKPTSYVLSQELGKSLRSVKMLLQEIAKEKQHETT